MSVTDETKAVAPEATTTVPAETKSTKEEQPVEKAADVPVEDKAEEAKVSSALPMHSRIPERAALLCFRPDAPLRINKDDGQPNVIHSCIKQFLTMTLSWL